MLNQISHYLAAYEDLYRAMLPTEAIRRSIEDRLLGLESIGGIAAGRSWEWTPASGGLSGASVWRVTDGKQGFAFRRWGKGADSARLAWISSTLRFAKSSGLAFIAAPIGPPFRDAHDCLWEATAWLPGEPLSESAYESTAVREAVSGLARAHQRLMVTETQPTSGRAFEDRLSRVLTLQSTPPLYDLSTLTAWPELGELAVRLTADANRAAKQLAPFALREWDLQPIHGDARPEHFLMSEGKLTGLIDFGAMRRDTVLADVARLAGELSLGDAARRDEVVGFYETAAERPMDRAAVAALDLAGAVLSAANWLRWLGEKQAESFDAELVRQRLRAIAARLLA